MVTRQWSHLALCAAIVLQLGTDVGGTEDNLIVQDAMDAKLPPPPPPREKVPMAKVENHRILGKDDLTYDFLAEMGFVPPPPPPPWGFSKVNGSLDEIEERVMRQLIPIADLPATMHCDACGAIALQLARAFRKLEPRAAAKGNLKGKAKRFGRAKEYAVLDEIEAVCSGALAPPSGEEGEGITWDEKGVERAAEHASTWDEYGVADMNSSCASPPEISCWNSSKRLTGPGCAKNYQFMRNKEPKFGWLTTRIAPECERIASDYGEFELYKLSAGFGHNGTSLTASLCEKDCARAERSQRREAHQKYTEDYAKWEQRQKWAKELGYDEDMPPNTDEIAEIRAEAKKKKTKKKAKKKKAKKTGSSKAEL